MTNILKDLETAFKASSAIPVSGDAVEALALVRAKLRKAYSDIEKLDLESKLAPETDTE